MDPSVGRVKKKMNTIHLYHMIDDEYSNTEPPLKRKITGQDREKRDKDNLLIGFLCRMPWVNNERSPDVQDVAFSLGMLGKSLPTPLCSSSKALCLTLYLLTILFCLTSGQNLDKEWLADICIVPYL